MLHNEFLELVLPGFKHISAIEDYKQEHLKNGETNIQGSSLLGESESARQWVQSVINNRSEATVPAGWVPATTFLGVRKADSKIVGTIDIRHRLNDFLETEGGHIGYGVRPSERRKGYAGAMLALALEYCRTTLCLSRVMVSCNQDNTGSRKTIEKNGGELIREFARDDGSAVLVFWIAL